jgi:hypothetical protein
MQEFGVGSILATPSGEFEELVFTELEEREGIASKIKNFFKFQPKQ